MRAGLGETRLCWRWSGRAWPGPSGRGCRRTSGEWHGQPTRRERCGRRCWPSVKSREVLGRVCADPSLRTRGAFSRGGGSAAHGPRDGRLVGIARRMLVGAAPAAPGRDARPRRRACGTYGPAGPLRRVGRGQADRRRAHGGGPPSLPCLTGGRRPAAHRGSSLGGTVVVRAGGARVLQYEVAASGCSGRTGRLADRHALIWDSGGAGRAGPRRRPAVSRALPCPGLLAVDLPGCPEPRKDSGRRCSGCAAGLPPRRCWRHWAHRSP